MGVKFSQLPDLAIADLSRDDKIAILDDSVGLVKKMSFKHDSEYRTSIGGATDTTYGHVMLSDNWQTYEGDASYSLAASQFAVEASFSAVREMLEWYRTIFDGTKSQWDNLSSQDKQEYDIVILSDV